MQGQNNDYSTSSSSSSGDETLITLMLVLIGAIVFIAGAIAEWESTEIFERNFILVPLNGFALGALIATALLWLLAIFIAFGSTGAGDDGNHLAFSILLIIAGLIAVLVVAISTWESFEWFGDDILIIPVKALQLIPLAGIFTVFAGTLSITAVLQDLDTQQPGKSTNDPIASSATRGLHSRYQGQEEIRRIARLQGKKRSEDPLSRIDALERELAALKSARNAGDDEMPADETENDDGDMASRRSKEIAELIRSANQD